MDVENKLITCPINFETLLDYVIEVKDINDLVAAKRNLQILDEETSGVTLRYQEVDIRFNFETEQQAFIDKYLEQIGSMDRTLVMNNINYLVKKNGIKISDLEELLEISSGYISRTMNKSSEKRLSSEHLWKIARLFNVELDALIRKDLSASVHPLEKFANFIDKLKLRTRELELHWQTILDENEFSYLLASNELKKLLSFEMFDKESLGYFAHNIRYTPIHSMGSINSTYTLSGDIIQCKAAALQGLVIIPFHEDYSNTAGYDFIFVDKEYDSFTPAFSTLVDSSKKLYTSTKELFSIVDDMRGSFQVSESIMKIIDDFTS